ncbi:hypothetical protein [Bartonella grahamii]|uniref:hypothetical protein n=1 Tax=Bartonella grahamii TaxID=33045 RepID=UPI00235DD4FF|nr:hypothetical protein [Bartonella grahamii]
MIEKSKGIGDNQKVLGYEILKQDLVKIMDQISPTYKAARGSAAKFKNFADSFEKGR